MSGPLSGATGQRGTGINYYDQATMTWGPIPNTMDRLETGAVGNPGGPGWGAHVYTKQGELVVSHSSTDNGRLIINRRENRHQGDWEQSFLKGPLHDDGKTTSLLWPTIVAVDDVIHMVCVTDQANVSLYNGVPTVPLYFRSTDGGKNWEDFKTFEDIMPAIDLRDMSADGYVITARGNHIVLAYVCGRAAYLESKDGGNTWTRVLVYDNSWDWYLSEPGMRMGPMLCATTIAAAIGDDGLVHIAFGTQGRGRWDDAAEPQTYYPFELVGGLITWKEGQPMINEIQVNEGDGGVSIHQSYHDLPYVMDAPPLLGHEKFGFLYWWGSADGLRRSYNNVGYVSHPRLIAKNGEVYLMYSSIIQEPMQSTQGDIFYRGVFLTVSRDNGDTWDQKANTSWLSYHPQYFFCDWSEYEGPGKEGDLDSPFEYKGTIGFLESSENGYPSMAMSIRNDRIVCTWLNDFYPYPEPVSGTSVAYFTDPWQVVAVNICISEAGNYNNIDQVWRGLCNNIPIVDKIENLRVYPNPANNMTFIEVGTDNPYTLTVTNIMGQVVHTVKGQQSRVELNVANYPAGVYIVNVKTAGATASQKLIVK
jgi:hypothetical protein